MEVMVARAQARYIRMAPRKLRQVVNLIKGKEVDYALALLANINKRATYFLEKTLKSAIANAKQKGFSSYNLFISKAIINPGPMIRRYRASSFGRATVIRHRTSHILIELDTKKAG